MSFLRGNFRKKAMDVTYDGIGGNFQNWVNGSNVQGFDRQYGGFVVFSFAGSVSGAGQISESATDMFSSTYGATLASNLQLSNASLGTPNIGMKIIPFAFMDFSGDGGSNFITYTLSATQALTGDDSIVVIAPKKYAVSGPVTSASNISVHFLAQGWIVSVPFYVH